jgi:hypothetical protein
VKTNDEAGALELIKASRLQPQQAAPDFLLRKGDIAGHEFHGNQYGGGGGKDYNAPSNEASKVANEASRKANFSGSAADHSAAAGANRIAYTAHDEAARQARLSSKPASERAHAALAIEHFTRMQRHSNKARDSVT